MERTLVDRYAPRLRELTTGWLVELTCGRGHHLLCDPPSWTYRVGVGRWDVWPVRRANLGNVLWAFGQWALRYGERR